MPNISVHQSKHMINAVIIDFIGSLRHNAIALYHGKTLPMKAVNGKRKRLG